MDIETASEHLAKLSVIIQGANLGKLSDFVECLPVQIIHKPHVWLCRQCRAVTENPECGATIAPAAPFAHSLPTREASLRSAVGQTGPTVEG